MTLFVLDTSTLFERVMAGQIDHAMNVSKRVFGALHPMIEDLGRSYVNGAMMQGFGKFDQAGHDVLGMHNNVEAQLSRLRRAAPEIGL